MTRTRLRTALVPIVLAAVGTLVMAGCGSQSTPATPAATSAAAAATTDLAGTSWNLDSYAGADGAVVAATASANAASLAFGADGTFTGSTGCNRIVGTFTQAGSSLTLQPGPMTLMACQEPAATQETALLAALPKVASFTSDASLVLLSADGATLLTYSPGLTTLAGTSWQATGINNGKDAVVGQAGTELVTAQFGADGQLSGSGGCNSYHTAFTTSGTDQITLDPVASTKMACPDSAMQIEQEYFAALGNVTTYQIDANNLTLRDAAGATQATFTLAP
jgi:heat shock protein HslJ